MSAVSIGVCAYNEERNIRACMESIRRQRSAAFPIEEILIVSSGSTDATDDIVRRFEEQDRRFRLVRQERREGKNSAINEFLKQAKGDIMVLVNADNRLDEGSLQHLLEPFADAQVGVAGGHPVPVNDKESVVGFAVHMLWDMHHRISLVYPKIGELMAFRRLDQALPTTSQSDEDLIRIDLEKRGLRSAYVPGAVVFNMGPATVADFWRQRTRVNIGEKYLKRWFDYQVPTWNRRLLFAAVLGFVRDNASHPFRLLMAVALEALARAYSTLYVTLDKGDRAVWNQVSSTKDLVADKR
ncbi:MAG: glycosyltransferase [Methanomassiliicoccales archaeon]|nr:glycosyltransferase [Methanomassiliicoccales archaeon]